MNIQILEYARQKAQAGCVFQLCLATLQLLVEKRDRVGKRRFPKSNGGVLGRQPTARINESQSSGSPQEQQRHREEFEWTDTHTDLIGNSRAVETSIRCLSDGRYSEKPAESDWGKSRRGWTVFRSTSPRRFFGA